MASGIHCDQLQKTGHYKTLLSKSSQETQANYITSARLEPVSIDGNLRGSCPAYGRSSEDVHGGFSSQVESVKQFYVKRTENYTIPQLERLYTRIMKGVFEIKDKRMEDGPNTSVLRFLSKFFEDNVNF